MNIIQMKQEIKDIRTELAAEIDKGMEMAKNRATTLESIKAQSDMWTTCKSAKRCWCRR